MAFVARSERNIKLSSNESNEIGPGQYIPQGIIKANPPSKIPFNTNTYRDTSIKKDDIPGPGSYDYDSKYEKVAQMMAKQREMEKSEPLYKSIEYNFVNSAGAYSLLLTSDKKKPGFLSKERRFKINNNNNQIPGPGSYTLNDSLQKSNLLKSDESISNILKSSSPVKMTGSPNRVLSIPSKNYSYGYDVNGNGDIVLNEDPDKIYKYRGIKQDSVGPGSYNVVKPKDWQKNSLDWNKLKGRMDKSMTNDNIQSSTLANSYDIHTLENINEGNNTIDSNFKKNVEKLNFKKSRERIFKQITDKRRDLLNLKTSKESDKLVEKILFNESPGPGYYYNDNNNELLKKIVKPEKFQVFGSSSNRFANNIFSENLNSEIGPGYYFRDDTKFDRIKINKIKNKLNGKIEKRNNSGSVEKHKSEKEEVQSKLGPGLYDPQYKLPSKIISNVSHFGSLQKRFVDKEKDKETNPGPGSYINHPKWGKEFETDLNKDLVRKYPLSKNKNDPTNIFMEKEKFEIPAVGSYNADLVYSIGYKVAQNTNQFQSAIAPFTSMQRRFKIQTGQSNMGPGQYYKERSVIPNQVFPPFKTGDQRSSSENRAGLPGPGHYNTANYFDWNKKSYNILYI